MMGLERDIKTILDRAFGKGLLSRDGINYALCCPACDDSRRDKKKLIVRLDDGRYHCWVCDAKGSNIFWLISKFRSDLLSDRDRIDFRKFHGEPAEELPKISLPPQVVMLGSSRIRPDPDIKAARNYLIKRGLDRKDMCRWRMLSCSVGKFRRRVIIPSFDKEGILNYYVTRTIDATKKMKYQNADVPKAEVIFNEIDMDWAKEVLLVEGVFDAIKCPENTLPILGSSFSKRSMILRTLMKHQTPCVVSLDPDMKQKAYRVADLLVSAGCSVRIAFAPTGKDLGDLKKSEVSKLVKSAPAYNDMMRITHKISEIKSGSLL